jgi:hypothetical protein
VNRGAALFWRYAVAKLTWNPGSWHQALNGLLAANPKSIEQTVSSLGIQEFAVGQVNLVEYSESQNHLKAVVEVHYSFLENSQYQNKSLFCTLLKAQKNERADDFASMTCHACGGPRGTASTCEFCGRAWPDPAGEWLLSRISEYDHALAENESEAE